jgi:hypothetical protein
MSGYQMASYSKEFWLSNGNRLDRFTKKCLCIKPSRLVLTSITVNQYLRFFNWYVIIKPLKLLQVTVLYQSHETRAKQVLLFNPYNVKLWNYNTRTICHFTKKVWHGIFKLNQINFFLILAANNQKTKSSRKDWKSRIDGYPEQGKGFNNWQIQFVETTNVAQHWGLSARVSSCVSNTTVLFVSLKQIIFECQWAKIQTWSLINMGRLKRSCRC